MGKSGVRTDLEAKTGERPFSFEDLLLIIGFGLMLGWHYLVLFSPVFGIARDSDPSSYLFNRQLTLYLALALAFGIIGLVSWRAKKRGGRLSPTVPVIYLAGGCAVVASGLCAALTPGDHVFFYMSIAFLGATEAVLMFMWLRWFVIRDDGNFLQSFATYMIAGGAIALLVCCLQWPFSSIAASIAPGVSTIILARTRRNIAGFALDETSKNEADSAAKNTAMTTPAPSSANDKGSEIAPKPKRSAWSRYMAVSVIVYALSFGLLQGAFAIAGITLLMVDQAIVLVGILLAGAIIYFLPKALNRGASIDLMHRFSLLLFVLGAVGVAWFNLGNVFLLGAQIAIMAGFNLFDFGVMAHGMNSGKSGASDSVQVLEGGRPVVYLSLAAGLVLGFLIVGAVSQDLIGQTLTMICGIAIVALVATTLIPYYAFDLESRSADAQGKASKEAQQADSNNTETGTAEGSAAEQGAVTAVEKMPEDWMSPWRSACTQIAKLYQLSPRETEIFFLVAKGRNADFVQQKLVISTHTAKTHIANIYRKLEVHSSQELLDLVEAFRDAERRMAESDDGDAA